MGSSLRGTVRAQSTLCHIDLDTKHASWGRIKLTKCLIRMALSRLNPRWHRLLASGREMTASSISLLTTESSMPPLCAIPIPLVV